jgi:hypothetical protein
LLDCCEYGGQDVPSRRSVPAQAAQVDQQPSMNSNHTITGFSIICSPPEQNSLPPPDRLQSPLGKTSKSARSRQSRSTSIASTILVVLGLGTYKFPDCIFIIIDYLVGTLCSMLPHALTSTRSSRLFGSDNPVYQHFRCRCNS